MDGEQVVQELAELGCLVEPGVSTQLTDEHVQQIRELSPAPMVVNEELLTALRTQSLTPSERSEHGGLVDDGERMRTSVEVLTAVEAEKKQRDVNDFVAYYTDRYEQVKELLLRRRDVQSAVSLNRVAAMDEEEQVAVVGMVRKLYRTSSGRYIVYLEDPTGETKVLVDEQDGDHILEDEVVGVNGTIGDDIIFADDVIWPDIPLPSETSSTDEEVYAGFISDIHFGSIDTLDGAIDAFVEWLNAENEFTAKVKYLFLVGDAVEGIGTYPGQEEELEVTDIYKQYERFQEFVERIRDDIQIIICPGNHDMVRLAEPQPPLPQDVVPALYEMEHVHFVPNPCWVRVHGHDNGGVLVLLYHGYSFDEHVSVQEDLREDAYEQPDLAMIDYLKRRHLAPIYGSNLLVPQEEDMHVIDRVPDIFATGHTHSFANTTYKGVNVICAGTFQGRTDFQKRVGHEPDPGKVAFVNLQTRESAVKEFYNEEGGDE